LQAFRLRPWEIVLTHREFSRMIGDNRVATTGRVTGERVAGRGCRHRNE
jgi:hypothetical protein